MPRKEARHSATFARQLERVFAHAPRNRKKFTRTPSRKMVHGGATLPQSLQRQQRFRQIDPNTLSAEDRVAWAAERDRRQQVAWQQHLNAVQKQKDEEAERAAAPRRATENVARVVSDLGLQKGSLREQLLSGQRGHEDAWAAQAKQEDTLTKDQKIEQVNALVEAALAGQFALGNPDALDVNYYRFWLAGVSPKALDVFDRALRKGTVAWKQYAHQQELENGPKGSIGPGAMSGYTGVRRDRASPEQLAQEQVNIAQDRQDIEDGIATEQQIRNVYYYDHRNDAHSITDDLLDLADLYKEGIHTITNNDTANAVMAGVSVAAPADPTGATELISGAYEGLQALDTVLQMIPIPTRTAREQEAWNKTLELEESNRKGNIRNIIYGTGAGRRRVRRCALASRTRHH
jgi:hypothetical protein